jgi:predicted lipoprotein
MRLFCALLLACALIVPAAAAEPSEVLRKAVDSVIRPGFAQWAGRAVGLEKDISNLCAAPSDARLRLVRQQFGKVVDAYGQVSFLRFGPLVEASRAEHLLFWPDRKGIGLRQVQAILANEDATAIRLADLQEKSVAVQGLGALEFVFYGDGSERLAGKEADFRCEYARSIAAALVATTAELSSAWSAADGIASHLAEPQLDYVDYRSDREALEGLVGSMAHGVELIRDTQLLPFIGRKDERPKPRSALFWRSGQTLPLIRAQFAGIESLLASSGIGQMVGADDLWVDNSARFGLANARRAVDIITLPVEQALADPAQRRALDHLVILTGSLQTLLGENLSVALGLSVGF